MKKTLFLLIHVLAFAVGSIQAVNQNHGPLYYGQNYPPANNAQQVAANPLANQIPLVQQNQSSPINKFSHDIAAAQKLQKNNKFTGPKKQSLGHRYLQNRSNINYFVHLPKKDADIAKNPQDLEKFKELPLKTQQALISKCGIITPEVKRERARQKVACAQMVYIGIAALLAYKLW